MQTAIVISLIAIILAFLEDKKILKYGLLSSILVITVFVGIRYEWGTDMPTYQLNYNYYAESGLKISDFAGLSEIRSGRSLEFGWAILNVLCKPIGFFGMVILLAIVENILLFDFIKRNVDKGYYWLAIFVYAFNPYLMVLGCSMMRQWLAMCIILFATRYIISGRFWIYVIMVLLASSFHTSALLFIVLYVFRFLKQWHPKNGSIIILGALALVWVLLGSFFAKEGAIALISTDAFGGYAGELGIDGSSSLGFGVIFKLVFYLFCVVQAGRVSDARGLLCLLLLFYIVLLPFTVSIHLASRMDFYIDAITIAAVPVAMKANRDKSLGVLLIGLYIAWNLFLYKSFFSGLSFHYAYINYHTIFESSFWQ